MENFLLFDSGNNNQRILIFGTTQTLDILQAADNWYCDGTFKASPSLFDQLFVIQGQFREKILPLLHVLMPNRLQSSYERALAAICNLKPNLTPATVMSDFEQASLNAFHDNFPAARQRGCFFHFSQAVWKHIQQYSLIAEQYRETPDFAMHMKMLAALAFVPPEAVGASYDALLESAFFDENEGILRPFLHYFESTWIGSVDRRQRRRPALFDAALWNCRQTVLEELGKTNNACEGFNRAINSMLGSAHPTTYKLIDSLKKQHELTKSKIEEVVRGDAVPSGREMYKKSAARLKKVVETYDEIPLLDYLRGVAHNIEYNV